MGGRGISLPIEVIPQGESFEGSLSIFEYPKISLPYSMFVKGVF